MSKVTRSAVLARAAAWVAAYALTGAATADEFRDALAKAYTLNPTMAIARSQLSAGDEGVAIALAGTRPNVLSIASYGVARYDQWPFSTEPKGYTYRYNDQRLGYLDAQQTLYSSGGVQAQVRSAQAQALSLRGSLRNAEQQVLLSASAAYLDLWLARRKLSVYEETERDLRQQLVATRLQFERKDVTVTDLGQTEARLAQAEANRARGESGVRAAEANYQAVIGVPPTPAAPLALPEIAGVPARLEEALRQAVVANPSLATATGARDAAREGITAARAGALPSVSAEYQGIATTGSDAQTLRLEQQMLLGRVSIPLYAGGAVGAQVRAARSQAAVAEHALDEARRSVVENTVSAWHTLSAAVESLASSRQGIESSALALRGVEIGRGHGHRTILEVLNARGELETARLAAAQAERDRILAQLQLLAAAGALNAVGLALPVTPDDPLPHYERVTKRWSDWSAKP